MAALEGGVIANIDENRMVGHYWLRAPELAPTKEIQEAITNDIEHIETAVKKVHEGSIHPPEAPKFTDILAVGIGGSALGPQFISEALAPDFPPLQIHFIDNTDPAGIKRVLNRIQDRLKSTLIIDTSKSGGTPEPRNGMLEVKKVYEKLGLNFAQHAVAVTMEGSKMDELARAEGWLGEFPENDRDSITITIPQINPRTVGALVALYERAVSFYASLVNINAYHQPGVEAGKKAAASILELQTEVVTILKNAGTPLDVETIAAKAGAAEQVEAVYKILRHLAANQRGIALIGDRAKPGSLKVALR